MDSAGAKSPMSRDIEELIQGRREHSNAVRGHKANLANPNASDKSKENSQTIIKGLGGETAHYGEETPQGKDAAENIDGSRAMKERLDQLRSHSRYPYPPPPALYSRIPLMNPQCLLRKPPNLQTAQNSQHSSQN
ncbi:uncharacterized protein BCR38DRAFT_215151 [Pseudomassariella vexata]|uniref:Conidiation protein 6-domain-containing protein n=1 Tax=Pseudomassariella vexata TaxID=1141098 RepID=A0A1Y2DYX2_9PEZI|nr:uncharacterized protein BCR38DRAFT_215151 [Pseudomassariella vexata]ORY64453.1 hypothetical protein BCR38DRAFT_215151 [Pseudomassariella vexata]